MMRSAGVYILLAACAVVLLVSRGAFGFYDDSGIHLLQASMAQQGFRFYTEMPFDHPHGLTYLLLGWFSIFGTSHLAAQLLAISFSLLLFWAVFMVASRLRDEWAGHLSVLLLVGCIPILKFTYAVVLVIPTLALSTVALYLAMQPSRWRLVASGMLLAAASLIKFSALYFAGLIWIAILLDSPSRQEAPRVARRILLWTVCYAIPLALALWTLLPAGAVDQLIAPHRAGQTRFDSHSSWARRALFGAPGMLGYYLCVLCALAAVARQRAFRVLPIVVWGALILALLLVHSPVWAHHFPEFLVPCLILIGIGASHVRPHRVAAVTFHLLLLASIIWHLSAFNYWQQLFTNTPTEVMAQAGQEARRLSDPSHFILVDHPMLAFLARRKVPPELAWISRKRLSTGGLTEETLLGALHARRPQVILLCTRRFSRLDRFHQLLSSRYRPVREFRGGGRSVQPCRVYVLKP